ncbi:MULTISPECIES: CDP-alcohol phosphatidyltransferase family protein [unclassified Streptomyces]|uniref:CDP-alcohol phosphatidyltransferase family protein n=1 Tax=unclassified Streptomyces TaxID=2593676 RepID=UPI0022B61D52|nr:MULTISPECIES: CDP-alcohol phosphatidyltransferase family protein [unclassified Streptomyces]MCZ7415953.1 CDP-alcohol phosphatidyltransferase family protein [Streptomyces sp. WMMC897]MCZ7434238.1 CDP-alcohol phosphatidyltransferase family protein [Streptomyces sp. WMMC1477]
MGIPPLAEVRRLTEKKRDAWWTVLLVDPVATPLVRWTAMWTRFTPNQITWAALFLGLGAAACFAQGDWLWLVVGAGLYHLSFVLDCMDGKLARLTGQGTEFGGWLDYVFDRVRVLACAVCLMGGQYTRTGEVAYVWMALVVVFLDMLRYIDALQIFKVRHNMRKKILARVEATDAQGGAVASGGAKPTAFMEDLLRENPNAEADEANADVGQEASPDKPKVVDLHREFKGRFPWYARLRDFLLRHRIRTHVISGIEFQMAVFIVAPLVDAVIPVTVAAGSMLLLFELAIIYKLLLSTRDFARTLDALGPAPVSIPAQSGRAAADSSAGAAAGR